MKVQKATKIYFAIGTFALFFLWWLLIQLNFFNEGSTMYDLYSDLYGLMALMGGIFGLIISKKWDGYNSFIGKAILGLSLGLLSQFFGQIAYSYYFYVLHIENPYPSIGDIGYYATIPFYIWGVWYLGKAAGIKFGLAKPINYLIAITIPLVVLLLTYRIFLTGYTINLDEPLTTFLDIVNPLGQAVYISIAIMIYILTRTYLGGALKSNVILILGALVSQYFADFVFLYSTSREIWLAGGFNELMYLLAYFLMTFSVLKLNNAFDKLKN